MTTASEPTDDELVRQSLAGETRAFAQLVEKHQRLVFAVALGGVGDVAQAEDVAQEAFVEAWRDLARLRDRARVGAWIAGIARNLGLRWGRRVGRRRNREAAAMQNVEAVPTPLDSALDRETRTLVRRALIDLSSAYREVLVLYYLNGRSVVEVATVLGISEDLVKQRLSRGRKALRASLAKRVEGALDQLGPGKGFTAAVMVAVSAATMRTATAASLAARKVFFAMKTSKVVALGAALLIAGGLVWHRQSSRGDGKRAEVTTPASSANAPSTSSERHGPPTVHRLVNKEEREQLLHLIRAAHERNAEQAAHTPPSRAVAPHPQAAGAATPDMLPTTGSDSAGTTLDITDNTGDTSDWEKRVTTTLNGLLGQCYDLGLAEDPNLAGTITLRFTLVGEPDVGGVLESVEIVDTNTTLTQQTIRDCLTQQLYALELDPPPVGVTVQRELTLKVP
jgi:RNA polymerase sigma factor (sigma-70 family)